MKWFAIFPKRGTAQIEPVEIERETDYFVYVKYPGLQLARREAKTCDYTEYHPTWESAKSRLVELAGKRLNYARLQLQAARGFYGNVKGLKP
jgi:hypothetical protein